MVETTKFKESMKTMFSSPKFLALTFSFAMVNGSFNIYGSLIQPILDPFGFTSDEVSYFGAIMMVCGIISATLTGIYIEKTLNFRVMFILYSVISIIVTVALTVFLRFLPEERWIFYIIYALLGVSQIPMLPLSFDYGC